MSTTSSRERQRKSSLRGGKKKRKKKSKSVVPSTESPVKKVMDFEYFKNLPILKNFEEKMKKDLEKKNRKVKLRNKRKALSERMNRNKILFRQCVKRREGTFSELAVDPDQIRVSLLTGGNYRSQRNGNSENGRVDELKYENVPKILTGFGSALKLNLDDDESFPGDVKDLLTPNDVPTNARIRKLSVSSIDTTGLSGHGGDSSDVLHDDGRFSGRLSSRSVDLNRSENGRSEYGSTGDFGSFETLSTKSNNQVKKKASKLNRVDTDFFLHYGKNRKKKKRQKKKSPRKRLRKTTRFSTLIEEAIQQTTRKSDVAFKMDLFNPEFKSE